MISTSDTYAQDSFELVEGRRRVTRGTRAADAERTYAERSGFERTEVEGNDAERIDSTSTPRLEKLDYTTAVERGLPPLDFRPTVLGDAALYLSLIFYLSILGVLVYLHQVQTFQIKDVWAYFIIKILPPILGTITSMHMDAIAMALSRIIPFMLCADTYKRSDGGSASKALFSSWFPFLITTAMSIVTSFIVALKASFLPSDYETAIVVVWAVETLVAIYANLFIFILCVLIYFKWRVTTGLRWDPVSMADQLALFRHSDFLEEFAGTCFGDTQGRLSSLKRKRLRLGYWKKGSHYWHGFGIVNDRLQNGRSQPGNLSVDVTEETRLDVNEISYRRYSSASVTVRPWAIWSFTLFTLVLLVGSIIFIIMGSSSEPKNTFTLPFSSDITVILVSFVLTFFVSLCTDFFEALSDFIAETEPFVHLAQGGNLSKVSFCNANETVLLNYTSLTLPVAIHTSFTKGHWKVLRTKVMGKVQHLFPIIVAGSFTIYEESEGSTLRIDFWLFVVILIWLALCLVWVPFETLRCEDSRFLPQSYSSLADLLSWAYASSLLHGNIPGGTESDPFSGDPLNIMFIPEGHDSSSQSNISGQEINNHTNSMPSPDSRNGIKRTAYDREHMEARLTLTHANFCFGLTKLGRRNKYTVGICDSSNFEDHLQRPKRRSSLLQFLWPTTKKFDSASGGDNELYRIGGLRESTQTGLFHQETQGIGMQLRPVLVHEEEDPTDPQS